MKITQLFMIIGLCAVLAGSNLNAMQQAQIVERQAQDRHQRINLYVPEGVFDLVLPRPQNAAQLARLVQAVAKDPYHEMRLCELMLYLINDEVALLGHPLVSRFIQVGAVLGGLVGFSSAGLGALNQGLLMSAIPLLVCGYMVGNFRRITRQTMYLSAAYIACCRLAQHGLSREDSGTVCMLVAGVGLGLLLAEALCRIKGIAIKIPMRIEEA